MNDPVIIRRKVRAVLAAAGRRKLTEELILAGIEALGVTDLRIPELRTAIEWNHERNLIEYCRDEDLDADVWFLTQKGKEKEGLVSA